MIEKEQLLIEEAEEEIIEKVDIRGKKWQGSKSSRKNKESKSQDIEKWWMADWR